MQPPPISEQFDIAAATDACVRAPAVVPVTLRTIGAADAGIEQEFIARLSPRSRRYRFFSGLKELTPAMLARFINVDYPAEMALIATVPVAGREQEIGVARYAQWSRPGTVEFAVVVADEWQRKGVARRLLERLFAVARADGWQEIEGLVLRENTGMLKLMDKLGFTRHRYEGDPAVVHVRLALDAVAPSGSR